MFFKPFIIAEIGLNHNGRLDIAQKCITQAAKAGVDAVKFQNFKTEDFINDKKITHEYKYKKKLIKKSLFQICKEAEYKESWTNSLIKLSKKKGLYFISTPTSEAGIDHLKKFNIKFIKNGSDYLTHIELIKYMAQKNFQIILSTGMGNEVDIYTAIQIIKKYSRKKPIILHCVSQYPADDKNLNLKRINSIRKKFKCITGFSDHTFGYDAAVQSVSHGSLVFEKHFTINKNLKGPDHHFSLNPKEMAVYVEKIHEAFSRLGSAEIKPSKVELKFKNKVRIGIMVKNRKFVGEKLKKSDILYQKNCPGILPKDLKKYLGKKIKKNINKGSALKKVYF